MPHCLIPAALVAQNAELHVMPIRGNVFMLVGAGSNVTVSAGVDGMLVVDAGTAAMADKTLAMIIEIAFPEYRHQGGTMIVPGHGRLGDTADIAIYRNMVVVIRDRIDRVGRRWPVNPPRSGELKVVTNRLRPGYLRKNGVPYSANTSMIEYYHRITAPNGDVWLTVVAEIVDPENLREPFVQSTHFKRLAPNATFKPEAREAR